jgi:hypothetical protein
VLFRSEATTAANTELGAALEALGYLSRDPAEGGEGDAGGEPAEGSEGAGGGSR